MSNYEWLEHRMREAWRREILDAREEQMEDEYERLARRLRGPRLLQAS